MKRIVISLVIVFTIFFTVQLWAGISVNPVTIEVVVYKDVEKNGALIVGNTSEKPMKVVISPEKQGNAEGDISSWITFDPSEFIVKGFEQKTVAYKIKYIEGVTGEARCMAFLVADDAENKSSSVGIRFGVPVYAIMGGTEIIDATIDSINADYTESEGKGVLSGTIFVNNKSNVHIRPFINIQVFDDKGVNLKGFEVPFGQPAQANQLRPFMFRQEVDLVPGKYKLAVKFDYGKMYTLTDKILIGEKEFHVFAQLEKTVRETVTVDSGVKGDENK